MKWSRFREYPKTGMIFAQSAANQAVIWAVACAGTGQREKAWRQQRAAGRYVELALTFQRMVQK